MKFQPKAHILKTDIPIRIRAAEIGDSQKLLDLKRNYIMNTSTIPLMLDEYPNDVKNELSIITEYKESPNSLLLLAEIKNELIGNIDLTGSNRAQMSHTGMIGMGIKENWRNQGLGRLLVESVIDWAKHNSEIEVIWIDVYGSNELGYNLYKNTGFKVSGVIPNFFKEKNGYIDKIQMFQRIK